MSDQEFETKTIDAEEESANMLFTVKSVFHNKNQLIMAFSVASVLLLCALQVTAQSDRITSAEVLPPSLSSSPLLVNDPSFIPIGIVPEEQAVPSDSVEMSY